MEIFGVDPIWSNPVFVDASQNDTNKHIGKLALSLQQTICRSLHRFFLCPGACFVKIPVTFQALKALFFVVFAFKCKVSIVLRIIQWNCQLMKQKWLVCDRVWFENLPLGLKSLQKFWETGSWKQIYKGRTQSPGHHLIIRPNWRPLTGQWVAQDLDKWVSNLLEDLKQPLLQQLSYWNRGMQQLKGIQSFHNGH